MTIYLVISHWTNDDGWGISDPHTEASFLDEQKARQYIYDQTKQQTALDYGYADVPRPNGNLDRWSIRKQEVVD